MDPGQTMEELAVLSNSVAMCEPSHLLICGDFNIPQIDWVQKFSIASETHPSRKFLNIVQECLFQHVTQPTRYRDYPSVLDLLFTNEEKMISDISYLPGLGKGDHVLLEFYLVCYTDYLPSHLERFNFTKLTSRKRTS